MTESKSPQEVVLGFMSAAQTVLAVYASPDGPIDPLACYNALTMLLEDPALLAAQMALAPHNKNILLLGEPGSTTLVS